jgi:hypothetical protein
LEARHLSRASYLDRRRNRLGEQLKFQLNASGIDFDVDRFLAETSFGADWVYHRGEEYFQSSGFGRVLGNATELTFEQQVKVAVDFITQHHDEIRQLMMWPGVKEVEVLLTPEVQLKFNTVCTRSYLIPPSLIQACAALGLTVAIAVRVKWADGWEQVPGIDAF